MENPCSPWQPRWAEHIHPPTGSTKRECDCVNKLSKTKSLVHPVLNMLVLRDTHEPYVWKCWSCFLLLKASCFMGFTLDDVIKTHENGVVLWDRQCFTTQTRVAFALRECYSPHKQLQNVLLLKFNFFLVLALNRMYVTCFIPNPELHVHVIFCLFTLGESFICRKQINCGCRVLLQCGDAYVIYLLYYHSSVIWSK